MATRQWRPTLARSFAQQLFENLRRFVATIQLNQTTALFVARLLPESGVFGFYGLLLVEFQCRTEFAEIKRFVALLQRTGGGRTRLPPPAQLGDCQAHGPPPS